MSTFYLDWHQPTTAHVPGRTFFIHIATREDTGDLHLAKVMEKDRLPEVTVYFHQKDPTVREVRRVLAFATHDPITFDLTDNELTALAIEVVGVAALAQEF